MRYLLSCIACLFAVSLSAQKEIQITERIGYANSIVNEDGEWWDSNLEGSAREKLFDALFGAIESGELAAYALTPSGDITQDAKYKLNSVQLDSLMNPIETTFVENLDTGELEYIEVMHAIEYDDITQLYTIESWTYDTSDHRLIKTVDGLCIMIGDYDPEGNPRGHRKLFTVWFDE